MTAEPGRIDPPFWWKPWLHLYPLAEWWRRPRNVGPRRFRGSFLMTEADELAEMRRQYRYANPKTHMLADGALHLRCKQCGQRPVPHGYSHVMWCDPCLDEALALRKGGRSGGG